MPVYTKLFLVFFLLVYFSYYAVIHIFRKKEYLAHDLSNILLLISSLAFYAYSGVRFLIVLLLFGMVTYLSGIVLSRVSPKYRKIFAYLFIFIEILPICLYRIIGLYLNIAGKNGPAAVLGLSFFSLQIVTYTYGVYANRIDAEKSIPNVMLFTCFFLCVSSGPIQRAEKLLPQIKKRRVFDYDSSADGLKLLAFGYFKKLVLADNLAVYIQDVRGDYGQSYALAVLLSVILYSFQLYLDFSGYSDIVTGCAKTLGFDLGKNFDHPYLSRSVSEFWRRWHISLSSWLRDFVYIPLGGSRVKTFRIYVNILVTFFISGLWHGAGITWIIWGLFHGVCLCIERVFAKKSVARNKLLDVIRIIRTFMVVSFGWIIFSSGSLKEVQEIISKLGSVPRELFVTVPELVSGYGLAGALGKVLMISGNGELIAVLLLLMGFLFISKKTYGKSGLDIIRSHKSVVRWGAYFVLVMIILFLGQAGSSEFIYNRF